MTGLLPDELPPVDELAAVAANLGDLAVVPANMLHELICLAVERRGQLPERLAYSYADMAIEAGFFAMSRTLCGGGMLHAQVTELAESGKTTLAAACHAYIGGES